MEALVDGSVSAPFIETDKPKRLLIGGEWVTAVSEKTFDAINPSTGEVLAQISEAGREDVDRAVAAARRAFEGPWKEFSPAQRQNVLLEFADLILENYEELRLLDVMEMGTPLSLGRDFGAQGMADIIRYYAGWTTKIHGETATPSIGSFLGYTLKEPVGVVGAIVPWNGPIATAVMKMSPVLSTGCTVILKPAEEASLSALRIGEIIQEGLDLPDGVVNVLTGQGETGAALVEHRGVDKITFTGSTQTGQAIVRASAGNLKRLSLELGGKSPDIVFADADLEQAIPGAGMGVYWNSGQSCVAGTRVFVERSIHDEFVEGLADYARSFKVGNSLDPETQLGPIVSEAQLERVIGYLELGEEEGARAAAGGNRLTEGDLANGYFVSPTVFADVTDEMRIAREEIFGPVISVLPFDTFDEVIERSNTTDYGLAGGLWTRDLARAHRAAESLQAGVIWVNTYHMFDPAMPFGGYKMSGWGRELSAHSLDEFLNLKAVWINKE